jgi:hypothetical protein
MRQRIRSSLPTVAWSKINQGIVRSKSVTRQQVDTIGMLVGLSEMDAKLKKIHGQEGFNQARFDQDMAFVEAMSQEVANTMIYGDEDTEESSFTGFQPRLETLATAITGSQVRAHHASPSGSDYTSMYIVDWHERYNHLIFPKDSMAGLDSSDKGEQRVTDADSNPFMAFVQEYIWMVGLTVKDPRHIGRLCNIDVSQALADTTTFLNDSLIPLTNSMPPPNGSNRVIYCHRDILSALELQLKNRDNVLLSMKEYQGEAMLHFRNFPFRACDQMSITESLVT